jgi:hypothetical protein
VELEERSTFGSHVLAEQFAMRGISSRCDGSAARRLKHH